MYLIVKNTRNMKNLSWGSYSRNVRRRLFS